MRFRVLAPLLALMCACTATLGPVGSWHVVAPPPMLITTHSLVTLRDGRIAFFGGFNQRGAPTSTTVLFDPALNVWSRGASMPGPLAPEVVVALHDGRVLVAVGTNADFVPSPETWIYDPARDLWSRAGSMPASPSQVGFALLSDGRVLVAGGAPRSNDPSATGDPASSQPSAATMIFDPATLKWKATGKLHVARYAMAVAALPDGSALAAGGCTTPTTFFGPTTDAAETFDPKSGSWTPVAPMPAHRCGPTATPMADGRVFVSGGFIDFPHPLPAPAMIFDPGKRAWSIAGQVLAGGQLPLQLRDGRLLIPDVQQGATQGNATALMLGGQIFDPGTGSWNFATTTTISISATLSAQLGPAIEVGAVVPAGYAVIVLGATAVAFHPDVGPPSNAVLDGTALTWVLGIVAALLALLLGLSYVRRTGAGKAPAPTTNA
jgi:hypothetical protein